MGIVKSQSIKNTFSTYLGFGLGAINTLFLYTYFLTDVYYGLVAFILSTSNIIMPLMAFGVHNTIIKYYSSYRTKHSIQSFLTMMLFLPLLAIIPIGGIGYLAFDVIVESLSAKNPIVSDYVVHIYLVAIAMAYFEVFFAWSKVHMQTVFGNFMKEVFHRLAIMILLFAVHLEWLSIPAFVNGVVGVYLARMLIMKITAFSIQFPKLRFHKVSNFKEVFTYSALIIIAGSVATLLLDIDKFMLNYYIPIEEVAYYSVAVFIATVIAVPQRAMHQILAPLNAKFLNEDNLPELQSLYLRSSITLFTISGLIFLLIVLNINQLYEVIPQQFSTGLYVVFFISAAKLFDSLLGSNNAILFNSQYYRVVVLLGLILAMATVVFNLIFIPLFGINGAAFATFLAMVLYNVFKLFYVNRKFKVQPISSKTMALTVIIVVSIMVFYFWEFPFHPLVNITLKSVLICVSYALLVLKFQISEDIIVLLRSYKKP